MYTAWTKHIKDPEEKARFESEIQASSAVLDRLMKLVKEEEDNLEKIDTTVKVFDNPNWAYLQAYYNGTKTGLNIFKKLIDLDQQRTK